jgi:hypothetical protein
MIKFIFSFTNFFLVFGLMVATAGNPQDTTTTVINRDSSTVLVQEADSTTGETYDSMYQPVQDTSVLLSENIRKVSAKQVDRYKNDPEYAYANDPQYWIRQPLEEPGLFFRLISSVAFRWIFLIFFSLLILYGIYQLVLENNFKLLVGPRRNKTEDPEMNSKHDPVDYDELIRINQADGNYRMAVRFLYLRLINHLREKNGLSINHSSTNAEIAGALGIRPETTTFRWLATAYEYIFYGEFVPDQETYFLVKNKFDAFQKSFPV